MRFLLETFRENPHLTSPDPWAKSQLSSDELNCWLGTLIDTARSALTTALPLPTVRYSFGEGTSSLFMGCPDSRVSQHTLILNPNH